MGFRLTAQEAWAEIAAAHTGVLTTLRRDGRPVALPVWHVVLEERIYVRTPRRSKKVARIAHDPRGSFMVESGLAWAELRAVVLPVRAALIDGDLATQAIAAIAAKYADYVLPSSDAAPSVRAAYADMSVIELTADGDFRTWDNAALVSRG